MRLNFKKIPFSLFVLLLTNLIDWMSIGLVYPMFSSMIFHEGNFLFPAGTSEIIKGTWLGVLLSSGPLAQFLSSPIMGALSDQKGRKPLLIRTMLLIIVGYFLSAIGIFGHSLVLLLFGRVIVGVGTGNAAVVYASIADISKPEEKGKHFGLASMSGGIGFTLGPFLGGTLSAWGYEFPFLFAMALSMLNVMLLIYRYSETHHLRREIKLSVMMGLKNLKKAFHIPILRTLFVSFFIFCVGWSFYWEFIPVTWIEEYHLNTSQVGNFFAYGAAFYALSSGLLIRPIVGRFHPLPILFISLTLLGGTLFTLLLATSSSIYWGYIPFQQFLIALVFPTVTTITSNSVKEDSQGEILGILQSVDSFAFGTSPLLAGSFVGIHPQTPIIVSGVCFLLAALMLFGNYRKRMLHPS
jgi:DHA1 family tetracycline resistance protein-like MFS transporter